MTKETVGNSQHSSADKTVKAARQSGASRDISTKDSIPEGIVKYCQPNRNELAQNKKALHNIAVILLFIGALLSVGIILLGYSLYSNYTTGANKNNKAAEATSDSEASDKAADTSIYDKSSQPIDEANLKLVDQSDGQIPDHFIGPKDAKVTVIEYADFTCPYCQSISGEMREIRDKYKNKVLFIYRNFNIGHTYSDVAMRAAEAAYLAGGEDAYWKFNEALFNDSAWTSSTYMDTETLEGKLKDYARNSGVDAQKLLDAYHNYTNNNIGAKIDRDKTLGSNSNVQGTPTIIVNGKMVASYKASTVKRAIDDALGK